MKPREPREKLAAVVRLPSLPQRHKPVPASELAQDQHRLLTEALRAKDARLQELLQDRDRFTHVLQNEVLEPLYQLEATFSPGKTRDRQAAGHPGKQMRRIIQGVRERILSLEADVITGFEFESELHQLAAAARHFGNLGVTISVDPRSVALLTQEESRRLLCVARSLLASTLRCSGMRNLDMMLISAKQHIRFVLLEDGTHRTTAGPRINIDEIDAHVAGIGGRVMLRRRPRFELTVVLSTATPVHLHGTQDTDMQPEASPTHPQPGIPRHA
ncbi:MAG: hypothetical protein KF814_09310 [Nitrospiraceae bacterium]|nr:hypothetical protein [Nitrospiraceae bacterium]